MTKAKKSRKTARAGAQPHAETRVSRMRRPEDMSAEDWQRALRRQFGREQGFRLENLGDDPVFSEFAVTNPQSGQRYRVAIRGPRPGENYCSCPDFATNDLGTCKHVEYTLGRIEARRGGRGALRRGFHPPFSEIFLDYAGRRRVRLRLGDECPKALRARAGRLFDAADGWTLSPERFAELPAFRDAARAAGHELRCYDDVLALVAEHRDIAGRRQILDQAYPQGATSPGLKGLLAVELYPYQAEGVLFAARAGRSLIGDEMGLGKTVQAIGAMELFARHFGAERVLVVCPTSLKHQWRREIARFAGRDARVVGGQRAIREATYAEEGFCKITNYETLGRDLDLIRRWAPDVVILDEAQRVKNWSTIAARALKRIESTFAVALTGTPLENRLEELISIVQFVDRYRLGPTWRLLQDHQVCDERGRVVGYRDLDRIGITLAPVLLRRRKAEVLEQLPERVDNTLFVPMTPEQRVHHEENAEIVRRIVRRWRKTGYLSEADQRRLTCALQNMRMACNSTFLLDHQTDHGHKADELIAILDDLLQEPVAKVVVFSQWLRTHQLVARRLEARGWGHVLFHGGVPGDARGALIDRFVGDPDCRVFLSTDAGGVGLNLQHAAACVVNMDLPWNPAVLEQRIGRVHRLGQTRGVQVVNLVAQGTIEEGMLSVLAFKKSLFAGVLDGGDGDVALQGTRLSSFMESVEEVTGAMAAPEAETMDTAIPEAGAALDQFADEPVGAVDAAATAPRGAERPADPWGPLLEAGIELLEQLAVSAADREAGASPWIETDRRTGQRFLKLPVPDPDSLGRLADGLRNLLGQPWTR
mgnify:CR=1 FL=1